MYPIFQDLRGSILKIAEFLGRTLDDEQIRNLTKHLSFENMKNNPSVNRGLNDPVKFIRRKAIREDTFMSSGKVGKWKEIMTQSVVQRFHEWEQEHIKDTNYPLILD